jgi:hypothetical protein
MDVVSILEKRTNECAQQVAERGKLEGWPNRSPLETENVR